MENKSTDGYEEDEDEELGAFIYRISRAAKKNNEGANTNNGEARTAKDKVKRPAHAKPNEEKCEHRTSYLMQC